MYIIFDIVKRLYDIEEILGNSYDLDRLRELAQADLEGRVVVLHPRRVPSADPAKVPTCFYPAGAQWCSAYTCGAGDDEPLDVSKRCWFCDGNEDFGEAAEAAVKEAKA